MDLNFNSLVVILAFLSLVFALLKSRKAFKTGNNNSKLPPGPWKLPIIGSMHHLIISRKLAHHTLTDLAKRYGPLMHLKLGQISTIVISSPEIVKETLKTHDLIFSNRPATIHTKIFYHGFPGVALTPYGSVWRQGRKICAQELLSANRVKSFQFLMEEEVSNLVASISSSNGTPVNLTDMMFLLTSSVLSRAAFGKKYRNQEKFLSAVKQALKLLLTVNIADFFPSMGFLNIFTGSTFKLRAIHKQIDDLFDEIIEDHKTQREIKNDIHEKVGDNEEEDLVSVLLRLQESGNLENNNIKAIIFDMFAAGTETTALSIVNVMSVLVKNPPVMVKAQAEVRKALAGNLKLDRSVMNELLYLKCVIKETFRLHPPGPLLFPREGRERCEIDGYLIPAKTQVMVNAWALGRNSKYWDDAQTFYPERFEGSSIDFKSSNFEFTPFGMGRRICPGMSFALDVMEIALVQLLYHFNWKLPNGLKDEELDMTEVLFGLAIHRKYDLLLIATPYAPLQE